MADNFDDFGEYEPEQQSQRSCCICDGPWDIPKPVKNASTGRYIPAPNGDGWCWDCWDKR